MRGDIRGNAHRRQDRGDTVKTRGDREGRGDGDWSRENLVQFESKCGKPLKKSH